MPSVGAGMAADRAAAFANRITVWSCKYPCRSGCASTSFVHVFRPSPATSLLPFSQAAAYGAGYGASTAPPPVAAQPTTNHPVGLAAPGTAAASVTHCTVQPAGE